MLRKNTIYVGLFITILLAVCSGLIVLLFYNSIIDSSYLFHAGIDVLGTFVCAVLFYGCMWQVEDTTRSFSVLVILLSASFILNEIMWFFVGVTKWHNEYFICCLFSKLFNIISKKSPTSKQSEGWG